MCRAPRSISTRAYVPHSWSLAVEEHFYLLLPLTVAAIPHRCRRAGLAVAWAVVSVGCPTARAFDRAVFPTFPTHHNLDALAWGVVLAYVISARSAKSRIVSPVLLILLYLQFLSWFFKGGKMLRDR